MFRLRDSQIPLSQKAEYEKTDEMSDKLKFLVVLGRVQPQIQEDKRGLGAEMRGRF